MNTVIDADAAKLAGLQIDLLQKLRRGQVTLDHLEWFNRLTKDARDAFVAGTEPVLRSASPAKSKEKFSLFVDLGVIIVPDGYDHATWLDSFYRENRGKFSYYNDAITDEHFANATTKLVPGRKLRVRVFKQVISGTTTSDERMAFLKSQKAVLTGAQGASLVFEQKRDELPKGYWYVSFDGREALWEDAGGRRGVPLVHVHSDGGFDFYLGSFGRVWDDVSAFLCFCDLPDEALAEAGVD